METSCQTKATDGDGICLAGFHHGTSGSGSPGRSTTGSHELEDTYGAYRLRSECSGR